MSTSSRTPAPLTLRSPPRCRPFARDWRASGDRWVFIVSAAAPPPDEDPIVAVYDGRLLIGLIFDRRDGCIATGADRRPLGRFANWREASTAIHEARDVVEVAA